MLRRLEAWRRLFPAFAIGLLVLTTLPVTAQQATRVNPTESSVREKQLLDALKPGFDGSAIRGRVSIPDTRSGTLIQPGGRDWQTYRRNTLPLVGYAVIGGMLALLVLFLLVRGRIKVANGLSGETVTRFNSIERFGHWLTATSFVVLALTGLNVTFGRSFVLPLMGPELFTEFSQWAKYLHNYMSFAFVIGLVMIFAMWVVYNLPMPNDFRWIAEGGGIIGDKHPPAGRFNAGQKVIFWLTIVGGLILSITGFALMFPFYQPPAPVAPEIAPFTTNIAGIQTVSMVHGIVAVLMVAVILAHIYTGTVGMQGAFWAMGTGEVDKNWARQHHSIWASRVLPEEGGKPAPAE
jgi:formate dehydrogenase subunit gamma